jgi:hypothetical protein
MYKKKMLGGGRMYAKDGVYMEKKKPRTKKTYGGGMSRTNMMEGGQPHYSNGEMPKANPN